MKWYDWIPKPKKSDKFKVRRSAAYIWMVYTMIVIQETIFLIIFKDIGAGVVTALLGVQSTTLGFVLKFYFNAVERENNDTDNGQGDSK